MSWRWVRGYKNYFRVSKRGRVRSVNRTISYRDGRVRFYAGCILSPSCNPKTGYLTVGLSRNGKAKHFYVHRLVAEAFIPNPHDLPEVNHKDLNKTNNTVDNLEWSTHSGNKKHAVRNGVKFNPRPKKGEESPNSKLTWIKVRKIRRLWATGKYTQDKLAEMFGVTQTNVYFVVTHKTWVE